MNTFDRSTVNTSLLRNTGKSLENGMKILNIHRKPETLLLINDTYMIGRKLGHGSFGEVYEGADIIRKFPVAIKMESIDSEHQILAHEYKVYSEIYHKGCTDLAQIYYFGIEDDHNVLVMDALGPSLQELHDKKCNGHFSLKTTVMLGSQMLSRLEFLHNRDYIHRDLKPENFLIGLGHMTNKVYLIDYGLAKRYRLNDKHISFKNGYKLVGTARYASLNSHFGIRLSRRDDLESLLYILVYFIKGQLPWQSLKYKSKVNKYNAIMGIKAATTSSQLCNDLPNEFKLFLDHVKSLDFIEKPNYKYLHSLLNDIMRKHRMVYDLAFDFIT